MLYMKPKESVFEQSLRRAAKRAGGEAHKWAGFGGNQDRIVDLPGLPLLFVECKRWGRDLEEHQAKFAEGLRSRGRDVCRAASPSDIPEPWRSALWPS